VCCKSILTRFSTVLLKRAIHLREALYCLASCTMGTGSFPGVKSGCDVTLTPRTLLVPCSRKSRAIPLLPIWTVCPVKSLSACTRVHFTFLLSFTVYYKVVYGLWNYSHVATIETQWRHMESKEEILRNIKEDKLKLNLRGTSLKKGNVGPVWDSHEMSNCGIRCIKNVGCVSRKFVIIFRNKTCLCLVSSDHWMT
jgi:hypothetical protein